ncbi:nucleoside 2-deoxyribosyltransferase [Paenibacillus marchantiae]|uniref:nucleoside 2-deoxyribosyltransferase n=1 Tax=Paenibacillus marchantiae TaxID=3026433 RepID=UPI00237B93C2|nr:nucleoside 2-deoxyribosyltransferase [Paenibacillus marchantiae]WDQ32180.1 nucleoside 2-deoxyribosyltransferase [Paenibacillus marchantiae]
MKKILVYTAGKIGKNDWRHTIFKDLRQAKDGFEIEQVNGFNYCGPYFIKCDHGCYHGGNSHGRGLEKNGCGDGIDEYNGAEAPKQSRYNVVAKCLHGIHASTAVFAWIDQKDAYGTIAEIGYAVAQNKPVFVAISEDLSCLDDMWFPAQMATISIVSRSAEEAWRIFVETFDKNSRELRKDMLPKKSTNRLPSTSKQITYLEDLLSNSGLMLTINLDELTREQASQLIGFIKDDISLPESLSCLIEYDI